MLKKYLSVKLCGVGASLEYWKETQLDCPLPLGSIRGKDGKIQGGCNFVTVAYY